jgi:group I intron endonuclease
MVVYRRTNTKNGKVYIGKTTRTAEERWIDLLAEVKRGSTNPVHNAIRKYGSEVFTTEILHVAKTFEELNAMETFFIILHQSHKPENGYNLTLGGDGAAPGELNPMWGKTHTDEVKAVLRALRLGTINSPESNEKRRQSESGEKNPAYGKVYMNDRAVEGRRKGGFSHLGKKRSAATRAKMSQSAKGKKFSTEHCLHISQAKFGQGLGRKHTPEAIECMREIKRQWWAHRKGGMDLSPLLS